MRYVLLVLAAALARDVSTARADPIPIFRVVDATMIMNPNVAGDHIAFAFTGLGWRSAVRVLDPRHAALTRSRGVRCSRETSRCE
jgi:hypothetical protein